MGLKFRFFYSVTSIKNFLVFVIVLSMAIIISNFVIIKQTYRKLRVEEDNCFTTLKLSLAVCDLLNGNWLFISY